MKSLKRNLFRSLATAILLPAVGILSGCNKKLTEDFSFPNYASNKIAFINPQAAPSPYYKQHRQTYSLFEDFLESGGERIIFQTLDDIENNDRSVAERSREIFSDSLEKFLNSRGIDSYCVKSWRIPNEDKPFLNISSNPKEKILGFSQRLAVCNRREYIFELHIF